MMRKNGKYLLVTGILWIVLFVIWSYLIQVVDVRPAGESGTDIGFATLNIWFHKVTGVHMWIYHVTDWLGLLPISVCMGFGMVGFVQLVKRKSLLKVDLDIILLGGYYVLVIFGYLAFEMIPINYRPILIEGRREASYPSSTTLLVLTVMPTLVFQIRRRLEHETVKKVITWVVLLFSGLMVLGRMISGVHWVTDIVGSVLLSGGMVCLYQAVVLFWCKE